MGCGPDHMTGVMRPLSTDALAGLDKWWDLRYRFLYIRHSDVNPREGFEWLGRVSSSAGNATWRSATTTSTSRSWPPFLRGPCAGTSTRTPTSTGTRLSSRSPRTTFDGCYQP